MKIQISRVEISIKMTFLTVEFESSSPLRYYGEKGGLRWRWFFLQQIFSLNFQFPIPVDSTSLYRVRLDVTTKHSEEIICRSNLLAKQIHSRWRCLSCRGESPPRDFCKRKSAANSRHARTVYTSIQGLSVICKPRMCGVAEA